MFKNPYFRDFINMYLGEGSKKQRNEVNIGNSNPAVLILAKYWFDKLANPERKCHYAVQIHADHDEDEIKGYWANLLGISPEAIRIQRKSNSGNLSGRQFRSKYGVLAIEVGDTYFRARLQAWMDYLEKDWLDNLPQE